MAIPPVSTHSVHASLRTDRSAPTTGGGNSGITDPSKRTPLFISGWNASNLSPNPDLHAAAHSTLAPTAEQKTNLQAVTNHVLGLNDSSLASRTTGSTQPPAGAPVGSASVSSGGSIPSVIQSAVNNLQSNTQTANTATDTNSIASLIAKILGGAASGGGSTQAQDAYYKSQTDMNNARLSVMNAPAQAQQQMASLSPQTAVSPFISPMGISQTGQIGATSAYQDANAGYQNAINAATSTGWTPYIPGGTPAAGSVTGVQMGGVTLPPR